jgi:hypothetical protein
MYCAMISIPAQRRSASRPAFETSTPSARRQSRLRLLLDAFIRHRSSFSFCTGLPAIVPVGGGLLILLR